MRNFFVIDGMNMAFRAHTVNFELKTANGQPTGMFFGFIRMLMSLKKRNRACKFIIVWDNKPVHKYALKADYKAGRTSLPNDVFVQVSDIKKWLNNCGVDQYEKEGQEADDVIATLTESLIAEEDSRVVIYSNDKDMLQLVKNGKVTVFKPKSATNPEKFYDEEEVRKAFGVGPSNLALFRSFDGDNSDNLDGVPRVPRKLIAELTCKCASVDEAYAALNGRELTDFQKKTFEDSKERVSCNFKLMRLDKALPDIRKTEAVYNKDELSVLLSRYEIRSIKAEDVVDLFSSSLNIRYSDERPAYRLETYSLFE